MEWVVQFIVERVARWIIDRGGWVSSVIIYTVSRCISVEAAGDNGNLYCSISSISVLLLLWVAVSHSCDMNEVAPCRARFVLRQVRNWVNHVSMYTPMSN